MLTEMSAQFDGVHQEWRGLHEHLSHLQQSCFVCSAPTGGTDHTVSSEV